MPNTFSLKQFSELLFYKLERKGILLQKTFLFIETKLQDGPQSTQNKQQVQLYSPFIAEPVNLEIQFHLRSVIAETINITKGKKIIKVKARYLPAEIATSVITVKHSNCPDALVKRKIKTAHKWRGAVILLFSDKLP